MSENAENLVLQHLLHIRSAVGRIETRLDDLTLGVGETNLAHVQVQMAEQSVRLDRFDARLARIEKRLDLAEA